MEINRREMILSSLATAIPAIASADLQDFKSAELPDEVYFGWDLRKIDDNIFVKFQDVSGVCAVNLRNVDFILTPIPSKIFSAGQQEILIIHSPKFITKVVGEPSNFFTDVLSSLPNNTKIYVGIYNRKDLKLV